MNLDAASYSDDERRQLLARRAALLDKMFAGTMTRSEQVELTRIRWALDRIEAVQVNTR